MHSGSKFINGHSDLLMGLLSVNNDELIEKIKHIQGTRGATSSPFDCFLMHRSLYTLEVTKQLVTAGHISILVEDATPSR